MEELLMSFPSFVGVIPWSDMIIALSTSFRIETSHGWITIILASGTDT